MARLLLNIAGIQLRSRVNGPGLRSVVWVQGCTRRCPGCFNPHTHAHAPRYLFEPQAIARQLLRLPDTEGITLSGGEPFEQAAACALLAAAVHSAGRSVVVFTGCPYTVLRDCSDPSVQQFLSAVDLLIAGPYIETLKTDGRGWLASANQTLHLLTDRLRSSIESPVTASPVVELTLEGRRLLCTGFPETEDLAWLNRLAGSMRPPDGSAPCHPRPQSRPSAIRHPVESR